MVSGRTLGLFGLVLGLLPFLGCGESGRLLIALERPSGALDPLSDARLSRFSLRLSYGGSTTEQETYRGGGGELTVGAVPVGTPLDLRLAGKSGTGLMLGLGQVLDLSVDGSGETAVAVKFRKPLGYVAGQSRVQILDTTAQTSAGLELSPLSIGGSGGVAAAANGVLVLVAGGSQLVPVRTADHGRLPAVSLSAEATCLGAEPHAEYAVICHGGKQSVGIVQLTAVAGGAAQERTVGLPGRPSRVVFGAARDRAWVLLDAVAPGDSCSGGGKNSTAVELNLAAGTTSAPRDLGARVADLAIDPRDGALVLALPCAGKLRRLPPGGGKAEEVSVPAAHDLAVADRNMVLIGRAPGGAVKGQAVLYDLTSGTGFGAAQKRTFSVPAIELRMRSQGTTSGYFGWVSEPQSLTIADLSVSPDSQRALCLAEADYASDMTLGNCTYRTQLRAVGYFVLDLGSSSVLVQRFTRLSFSQCHANCVVASSGQRLDNPTVCATEFRRMLQATGQMLDAQSEFEPAGATLLFGGI